MKSVHAFFYWPTGVVQSNTTVELIVVKMLNEVNLIVLLHFVVLSMDTQTNRNVSYFHSDYKNTR